MVASNRSPNNTSSPNKCRGLIWAQGSASLVFKTDLSSECESAPREGETGLFSQIIVQFSINDVVLRTR